MKRFSIRAIIELPYFYVFIGLILRLIVLLRNRSFWLDDVLIYNTIHHSWSELLLAQNNFYAAHGPLGIFLLKLVSLVNSSEFALRLPAAIFSALVIIPMYRITENLFSKRVAILTSIFLAVSVYLMEFGNELKNYPMLLFFESYFFYYLLLYFQTNKVRERNIAIIWGILSLWTDYSFIWMVVIIFIYFPLNGRKFHQKVWYIIKKLFKIFFIIAISYSWYWFHFAMYYFLQTTAVEAIHSQSIYRFPITFSSFAKILRLYTMGTFGDTFIYSNINVIQVGYLLLIGIVCVYFFISLTRLIPIKSGSTLQMLPFIWTLSPLFSIFVISSVIFRDSSMIIDYYCMTALLGWFFLLAVIASRHKIIGIFIISVIIIMNGLSYVQLLSQKNVLAKYDWRTFVKNTYPYINRAKKTIFVDVFPEPYSFYGRLPIYTNYYENPNRYYDAWNVLVTNKEPTCFVITSNTKPYFESVKKEVPDSVSLKEIRVDGLIAQCYGL